MQRTRFQRVPYIPEIGASGATAPLAHFFTSARTAGRVSQMSRNVGYALYHAMERIDPNQTNPLINAAGIAAPGCWLIADICSCCIPIVTTVSAIASGIRTIAHQNSSVALHGLRCNSPIPPASNIAATSTPSPFTTVIEIAQLRIALNGSN